MSVPSGPRWSAALGAVLLVASACSEDRRAPPAVTGTLAQALPAGCSARPCVLLIDDDRGHNQQAEWSSLLTSVGIAHTIQSVTFGTACSTDNAPGPLPPLAEWDLVFWSVGDKAWTNVSSANEIDAINYLTAAPGGRMVLAGMHVFYSEPSALTLYGTYMGATSNTMPTTPWVMVGNGDELCGTRTYTVNTTASTGCWTNMGSAWSVTNGGIGCGAYGSLFGISRKEVLTGVPYRTAMLGFDPGQLAAADLNDVATRLKSWMFRPYNVGAGGPYACLTGVGCALSSTGSDVTALPLTFEWDLDNDGVYAEPGEPTGQSPSVTFPTAGSRTIGVRVSNAYSFATATTTVSVTNPVPQRVVFTTAAQSRTAGACSGVVTVQTQDNLGNPANVSAATLVSLSTTSGFGTFHTDAACGTAPVTGQTIAAGANSVSFYYRDNLAGAPTLTASSAGLTSGTQGWTITAAAPSLVAFATFTQTLTAGNCSGVTTVQSRDAFGNPSTVSAATVVNLSSSSTGNTFYADATCTTVVTSRTIAAGTSSVSFYFRDTRSGAPTLTAAVSGWTSGTQVETINAGAAARVGFSSAPQSVAAGSCSGQATVQSQDAFGNAVNVGAATVVNLSSTSGGNTFYSDAACTLVVTSRTIAAGTNSIGLYFRDTVAGSPTLTAAVSGWSSGTQVQTVVAGTANRVVFLTAAQSLLAGACSGVATVQSRDGFNNPAIVTVATVVNLSSTSVGNTFYSDATCTTVVTSRTIAAGTNSVSFYFRDTRSGSPTLTAAVSGWTSGTQAQTISAAAASVVAFTSGAQSLAAGGCSALASLQSRDGYGNVSNVAVATAINLGSSSGGGTFYSNATCTTAIASVTIAAGTSTAGFYFRDTVAGSPTLTASRTGWTSGTQVETITAGTATRLAITTPPRSVTAGGCSPVLTVTAQDAYANASNVTVATTVNISSSSTGDTFYSDATCTTVVTSRSMAAGTSTVNFYFRDTVAGSPTVTASASGLTSGTQVETVTAAAPNRLAFTTAAQTISAGSCSAITSVQSRDAYNNPSNVAASTTVNLSSTSPTTTFFSNASCTTAVTSITIPLGGNLGSFYFRDTTAGSPTLTAAAAGLTSGTQLETITAAAGSRLVFITTAQSVAAGGCSAITTVQSQDGSGNPANVGAATTVNLSSSPVGGTFYSNSTCTTVVTSATIAAGTSTASFYWRFTTAGSPTITAAATGFTSGNQGETITPATATVLAFSSAAQTLTAGNCSSAATVQSRDAYGNVSNVVAAVTVNVSSSSTGNTFYADATCTTVVTSRIIAAGTSATTFYFRDNRSGSPTLTAAASGFTSGVQIQLINPGAAARLAITTSAATVVAGGCSPLTTAQSQDALNNPANVAAATAVTLASSSTGDTYYSDPGCTLPIATVTIAAGANSASFYWRDTVAGSPTLSVSATGLTTGTQVQTVTAAAATVLAFTTGAQTLGAGACSAVATTQTRDVYGNVANVAAATTLNYAAAPATLTFYSDATCTTAVTSLSMAAGTSARSFYFRGNTAGSPVVTVSAAGFTSATQTETITAGAASRLAFVTPPRTVTAGACSAVLTVQSQDASGNPANMPAATAVNLADSSGFGTFYSDSTCVTAVAGVTIAAGANSASFYWRDTRTGTPTLTASTFGLANGTQVETVTAAAVAALGFATAAQTVSAGACSLVTTAQSRDAYGNTSNVTAATSVGLSSSSAGDTFYSDAACTAVVTSVTIAAGSSTASFYWRDTVAGSPTLTLSSAGLTSGTQVQTVSGGAASRLGFANSAVTVTAGACSGVLTAQARDAFNNPVTVASATAVNLASSSTGDTFYSNSTCTTVVSSVTIAAGASTANFYFRDTVAGSPTVTISATGLTNGTQVETVSPASVARLMFTTAAQTLTAGACSGALTVQRQDTYGNPTTSGGALTVNLASSSTGNTFHSTSACGTAVTTATIAPGTSSATVYFRDTRAGTPTLTGSASGLTSATQVETINAGTASTLVFTSAPQTVGAGGCSAAATLESRDAYGNPANVGAATTVNLTSSAPTTAFFSNACVTSATSVVIAAGTRTATFYFRDTAVGTPTLTATAATLGSVGQTQTITGAAASALAFTTAAQTLVAGTCSGVATVQARDSFGNPAPVGVATSVGLSTSSTGGTFYSDAACTLAVANITIAAGTSTGSFYWRDTRAGAPTLTAVAAGLSPATQAQTVNPASPTRLAFANAPLTVTAGACSAALTVQSQDAYGNPSNVLAATAVGLSSSSGTTAFFLNSTCGTAGSSVTIAAGSSSAVIYFNDTLAGSRTLTASAGGFTPGTQVETVLAAAPSRVVFTSAAQTLTAGACSAAAVLQTRDAWQNPANVAAATPINLTSSSAGGSFFSDPACATAITQVTVPAGSSGASFYFRDTLAGSPTLTAASAGLTSGTQVETITPAAASRLVFITAAQSRTAGSCSLVTTVQSQDNSGNPSNVAGATTVSLSTTSTGGAFYSNSTCTTAITSATIAAGTSTTSFYWRDTVAGTPTLSAAAAGFTTGAQNQTVTAATATRLAFITAAQTLVAGSCSAVATVQSRDTYDNPSNVTAATAVTLTTSSTGGTFYSDAACTTAIAGVTIPAGSRTANFYWRDTRAGAPTLTASAAGFTNGTQAQTVNAAAPARLVIISAAQTLTANACSAAVTVQSQDTWGNPSNVAPARTVNLTTSSAGGSFYAAAGCASPVSAITIGAGTNSAVFYFRDTVAGAPTLTAASSGLTSGTQVETINPAAASVLAFSTSPQTLTAGACSAVHTVRTRDAFGNLSPVTAATVVDVDSSSPGGTFYSDSGCTVAVTAVTVAAGSSTLSFWYTDARAGTASLTASAPGFSPATQVATINAAAPSRLAFVTAPLSFTAGGCSSVVTVQSQDTFGNPSPVGAATAVGLSTSSPAGGFYLTGACGSATSSVTIAAGATTASFYYGDTRAGTATVTASAAGFTSGTQVESINAAAPSRLVFQSAPQSLTAGACSAAAIVQAQDGFGNPSAVSVATAVGLATSSTGGSFFSGAGCSGGTSAVTMSAGTSSVTFYWRDTRAGAPTLTASAAGLASATQVQTVNPAAPTVLVFTTPTQTVTAGGCSAVSTVQTTDAYGNPAAVSAATALGLASSSGGATFYSNAACSTAASSVTVPVGSTTASFYFRDTVAGAPTHTVSAGGYTSATQVVTITAGSPTRLAFTTTAQTLVAGTCSGVATVQARDAYNNASPVAAATSVSLTTSSTGGAFYADAGCTVAIASVSIAAGASNASFYFRDTRTGGPTLTASAAGLTSATQVQTINPAAATRLAFATAAQVLTAGACSGVVTVRSQDTYGNTAPVGAATTVGLATTSTGGAFYSDAGCTAPVPSVVIAGGASSANFYYRDTRTGSPTLTATAAGFASATQVQTVNPASPSALVFTSAPQSLLAGACSAAAALQTRDVYGNVSPVTAATVVALSSTSVGGSFFTDPACASPAVSVTLAAGASAATFYFRDTRAGSPTLTAAAGGLTSATQVETINAAAPSRLAFTSPPQALTAGDCSAATTVQAQDGFGNPSNVSAATAVGLSTSSPAGAFYSDSGCTTLVSAATIAAGTNLATFYFQDTRAGSPTLTASAAGLSSATQVQTINAASASRLAIVSLAQSVTAGACSGAVQVQSQDVFGNASNVGPATTVNLSSTSGTLQFFATSACASAVGSVAIAAGANLTTFYFRDNTAGTPTVTAAAAGLASAAQVETINPAPAARLVIITPPRSTTAGVCSLVLTVQSQDNLGNASNVAVATVVNLATGSAQGAFFSDAACGSAVGSVTIAAGTNAQNFYYRDTLAGSPTVSGAASGFASAAQAQTITPAAPTRLAVISPAQTLTAGACSAVVTVQARDTYNNPSNVPAATAINLATTSTGGTFHLDAACGATVTQATIAANANTATFYFRDTLAGTPTLTASAGGFSSATQLETINPASPSRLAFTSAAQAVTAGACSAATALQTQDAYGNPSIVGGATSVALSSSAATGAFYSDPGCTTAVGTTTVAAGTSSASFYFRDTRSGSPTLTASAAGFTAATQVETINPAAPARLVFVTGPQSLLAGACSTLVTLRSEDTFGNASPVAAATTVNLATTSSGGTFSPTAGCGSTITSVTLGAGSSTATFAFRDTLVGTPTLTATAAGLTPATQGATITPAPAAALVFLSAAQTLTAGACSAAAVLQTRDAYANPAPVSAATTVGLASSSTGATFYSDPGCTAVISSLSLASGATGGTFYFRDTRAGAPTLTASSAGLSSATQVETINAAALARLGFISPAQSVVAGSCSAVATVQSQDTYGNARPVTAATPVTLSSSAGSTTFYSDAGCTAAVTQVTIAAGANSASFYFRDTVIGTRTLTAATAGLVSATQPATVTPAAPNRLVFTTAPQTLAAGACSAVATLEVRDAFNNASPVTAATTVSLSSSGGGTFSAVAGCGSTVTTVTVGAGSATVGFYFRHTVVGSPTLTASAAGLTAATQVATITPAPASALAFTTAAQALVAGNCSAAVTVQTRDGFGNPSNVTAATTVGLVTTSTGGAFYSDSTCLNVVTNVVVAAGTNARTFYYRDTRAGSATVTASSAGLSNATQVETISAAAATVLAFTSTPTTVTAGACSVARTVQTRDAYGNPANLAAATTFTLSSSSGGASFFSNGSCGTSLPSLTIAAGANTGTFYFRDTVAGTPTLTVSRAGFTSATQGQTVTPATAVALAFATPPRTVVAGSCSAVMTVNARDTYNNNAPVTAATTVGLASSAGGTFYSNASCTTPVTSMVMGAGSAAVSFYYRHTVASGPTLTATATGLGSTSQVATIIAGGATQLAWATPAQTLTAGACSAVMTVQTRDAFGNATNMGSSILVTLTSGSLAGSFYADPSCNSPVAAVTVVVGTSSANLYYQDTRAGSPVLTAASGGLGNGTQTQTINPAPPSRLAFITPAQTVNAAACSAVATLQVQDAFGNASPVAAASSIALSSSSATGSFSTASSCGTTTSALSLGAGQSQIGFYFRDTVAGTPTLTAALSGLSAATQVETITSAPPAVLAFATPAQTLNAGACSAVMTVEARDGSGNPSPVSAATSVGLTTSAGTGTFYSDAGCTSPVSAMVMAAGQSGVSFYFRDTAVGVRTLTAQAAGLSPGTQIATITTAGSATRLAFITPAQTVVAGGCSALAAVQSQDSFGNSVNLGASTTVSLSSSAATGAFFTDPACTTSATAVTIAAGGNAASFYFRDTRAGTPTLTAAAAGLANGTQVETINPGAATALAYATPAQTIAAGACSAAIVVRVQDGYANPTTVGAVTAVALTTSSTGGAFYSDAACTTQISGVAIAAGSGSASFFYADTRAGAATVRAQSAGLAAANQVENISAGLSSRLAFTTAAQTVTAGSCSALVRVQVQDALGNAAPVSAATVVSLASTSGSTVFYADALCANVVTARTIGAGGSAVTLYFKDDVVGAPTLTASSAGLSDGTQVATIIAGPATTLAFASPARTVVAGACSAELLVETRDDFGNASAVTSNTSVVPTSSSAVGGFYSDPACTTPVAARVISAGQSAVSFYYRDTRTGSPGVTMSNPGLVSATQVQTVVPAAPARLAFSTAAQTVQVGACSAVATIEVRDGFDNASPVAVDTAAAATATSGTFAFYLDAACTQVATSVTVAAAGSQVSFYFRDTRAGAATATLTAPGLSVATQTETFVPAAPVALAFATPPRSTTAGACSAVLTVEARDALDNAASVSADTVLSVTTGSATGRFFSDAACTTAVTQVTIAGGASSAGFYFRDTAAGTPTVTAQSTALGSAAQQQTVVPGPVSKLAFATPPRTAVVTQCSPLVTVESRDQNDNPAQVPADVALTLSSSSGTLAFFADAACTTPLAAPAIAAGQTTTGLYFLDTVVGAPTLTAAGGSLAGASQAQRVVALPPVALFFVTPERTLPVGVCSPAATLEARDTLGNPSPVPAPLTVTLGSTSGTQTFYADAACAVAVTSIDLAQGQPRGDFYFRDSAVGAPTISAAAAGLTGASQLATFVNANPATQLAFVSAPVSVEAGACSTAIVLNTQDGTGAAAPLSAAITVALSLSSTTAGAYSDPTCTTRVTSLPIAANDYRATLYLKDAIVEAVTVSAQSPPLTGASQVETVVCPATVDGAFCDDGDLCNGRETCQGGACVSGTTLSCEDNDACTVDSCAPATGCSNVVTGVCCVKPAVARDANAQAVVGVAYRFNAAGQLDLLRGTGPVTFSTCASGPQGLTVDSSTGAVDWTPTAAGPATICLQATGSCGVDAYTFTVNVAGAPGPLPVAQISIPPQVAAGVQVTADASLSTPNPAFAYRWDFGDGSPMVYGARVNHAFAQAGGYRVRLTVFDALGQSDTDDALVTVTSASCATPPTVAIEADALTGADSLAVAFTARYQGADPAPVALWDFGDGTTAAGLAAAHTFGPGQYRVALRVVTADGCVATDAVTVEVAGQGNQAPHCAVVATPVAGSAPLDVTFTATFGDADGRVSSATWLFSDGVTADATRFNGVAARRIERPGALTATLEVIDDRGLPCRASVTVEAANSQGIFAPEIVSTPTLTAQCGVPWQYGEDGTARATGSRPIAWSLGKGAANAPEGMAVSETGQLSWTPGSGARAERVTLVAQNAAGAVEQNFVVEVECATGPVTGACGCSSSGGLTLLGLLALALVGRRRRR